MHHTALAMFIKCMMGDERAYGAASENPSSVPNLSEGDNDLRFEDASPSNSAVVRGVFNLESTGRVVDPQQTQLRMMNMAAFANKLLARAQEREQTGGSGGPLIDRLREIDDDGVRLQNMFATLIAGHDTTAYTMQFC